MGRLPILPTQTVKIPFKNFTQSNNINDLSEISRVNFPPLAARSIPPQYPPMNRATAPSPFGPLTLTEENGQITALFWGPGGGDPSPVLTEAITQLTAYFAGHLKSFTLPLAPTTGFAGKMRAAMLAIPFGETRTYGDLAREMGVTAQAVGQGCGANPLPILVPCHRILGANSLGGFSAPGGVETKVALLRHEGAGGLLI
jgi:methylated-DNA-[protein]-cysteine S-methyltransferase